MMDLLRAHVGGHAPVKRFVWRSLYQLLARRYADLDLPFMNYGYEADAGEPRLTLRYEDERHRLSAQLYHRIVGPVDLRGRHVLEVGSGRGGGAAYLAAYHAPSLVVGLDLSDRAAALSRRSHDAPGLRFVAGDAESLPFHDETFDAVVNVESSHCYGSMPAFLREAARVLRREGYLLFADLRAGSSVDALRRELRGCGLMLRREDAISAGVIRALEHDAQRRRTLIRTRVPVLFRGLAGAFAGVPGTVMYESLRAGRAEYLCCVLQKGPA